MQCPGDCLHMQMWDLPSRDWFGMLRPARLLRRAEHLLILAFRPAKARWSL